MLGPRPSPIACLTATFHILRVEDCASSIFIRVRTIIKMVAPPFTYAAQSHFSFNGPTDRPFNPRAATQASWTPPAPKVKKDGPLVEINRHPDSVCCSCFGGHAYANNTQYLIVPYGNLTATPMPRNTRKKVVRVRQLQLALRFLQLIGSCGMLFCVIAINKTSSSVGWIIRLAPAVALLHTFYGFYHFCRAATGRTPGSSASYMVFAAMMDIGLIPFFVFCSLMSHADYSRNAYGWSTLFKASEMSYKIIYSFFLISVTVGGMLVISLVLGVYLGLIFRKIAKLPPDMNPLEPTLTARPHKRNKSELTSEKHLSGTTAGSSDNLIAGTRRVPFMHTRTDSADSVTLYNSSPRASQLNLHKEDVYRHSNLSQASAISRPASAINPPPNARFAGAGLESDKTERASKASSWLSYLDFEGVPTQLSDQAEDTLSQEVAPPPLSRSPSPKPHRESKNWFTRSARNSQVDVSQAMMNETARNSHTNLSDAMPNSARPSMQEYRQTTYDALNANSNVSQNQVPVQIGSLIVPPLHPFPNKMRSREPLGMNPPTPVRSSFPEPNSNISPATPATQRYPLSDNGNARPNQTSRPSSFVGTGGKARFYGDLRSSIGSSGFPHQDTDAVSAKKDNDNVSISSMSESDYSRTRTMETVSSANFQVYHSDENEDDNHNQQQQQYHSEPVSNIPHDDEEEEGNYITYNNANPTTTTIPTSTFLSPRQVSASTGYDKYNVGGYAGLGAEFGAGMGRRREVSGKVAEEGRGDGGVFYENGRNGREGREAEKKTAAGWARFKGL